MRVSLKTAALIAAALVGLTGSTALADHGRYETRRISNGPRPDQYVLVRTMHRAASAERPYALTGRGDDATRRDADRPMPLHLKGPRGNY